EFCKRDRDDVGLRLRTGDFGGHLAAFQDEVVDPSGPGICPSAAEAARIMERHLLQRLDPPLSPPRRSRLLDLEPVLRRRLLFRRLIPSPAGPATHTDSSTLRWPGLRCARLALLARARGTSPSSSSSTVAPVESAMRSRSSSLPSWVIHFSPELTI